MKVRILSKDGHKEINLTRRRAIHERCLNCSCWVPTEITNCSFKGCSLHPLKTGRGKQNLKDRKKAIRKYCLWCMNSQPSEIKPMRGYLSIHDLRLTNFRHLYGSKMKNALDCPRMIKNLTNRILPWVAVLITSLPYNIKFSRMLDRLIDISER